MNDPLEQKLELTKSVLRNHHAGVEPDPSFVTRVRARLSTAPDPLRWAAARLLPAGLTLALLLGVLVWREQPANDAGPASVDELAAWMVDPFGVSTP
ncbi:MAG: hypothetical protein ACRD2Z_04920 [Thermoanaerobaculia bacterium]